MKDSSFDADPPLPESALLAFADGRLASRRSAFYARLNAPPGDAGGGSPGGKLRRFVARLPHGVVALVLAVAAIGGWMAAFDVSSMALNNAALMALMDPTAGRDTQRVPSSADIAAAPDLSSAGLRLVSVGSMKVGLVARASRYGYESRNGAPVVLLSASSLNVPSRPQWIAHRVGPYRLLMWTHVARRYVIAGAANASGIARAADAMTDAHNDK